MTVVSQLKRAGLYDGPPTTPKPRAKAPRPAAGVRKVFDHAWTALRAFDTMLQVSDDVPAASDAEQAALTRLCLQRALYQPGGRHLQDYGLVWSGLRRPGKGGSLPVTANWLARQLRLAEKTVQGSLDVLADLGLAEVT